MATAVQRARQIANAVINRTAPDSLLLKAGRAVAINHGRGDEFDAATPEQQAAFLVAAVRDFFRDQMLMASSKEALATMNLTVDTAAQEADADLAETP